MRKYVFFDTNTATESPGVYPIDEPQILRRALAEGDLVTAYMLGEREFWEARVVRCGCQWGIVLLSECREMSKEQYNCQQEGFDQGMLCQKHRAMRVLESLDLPAELLAEATRRMMRI